MQRFIHILLLSLVYQVVLGQNQNFHFRSIDGGLGFFESRYSKGDDSVSFSGLSVKFGASLQIEKHLFVLDLNYGEEFNLLSTPSSTDAFFATNVLYGREWNLKKWLAVETYAGLGLYGVKRDVFTGGTNYVSERDQSLGVPIDVKFILYPGGWSIGLNPGANFNNIGFNYYTNIILQYRFN